MNRSRKIACGAAAVGLAAGCVALTGATGESGVEKDSAGEPPSAGAQASLLHFSPSDEALPAWRRVRDELTGSLAEGTVLSVGTSPGCIYVLGEEPMTLLGVEALDHIGMMDCPLSPRLIAWRGVTTPEGPLRRFVDVAPMTTLNEGILKNPGPFKVQVTIVRESGPVVIDLAAGFGILIGPDELGNPTHRVGCSCACKTSSGAVQYITLDCPSAVTPCDCASYNGMSCQWSDGLTWGTTEKCVKVLFPLS